MYAEFDNGIEIDRNRQVLFDYSADMNTLYWKHTQVPEAFSKEYTPATDYQED
jgi:hypothetical protein